MDSSLGRFTSKDPILYLNLYRYVKNNPMRYTDRFGRRLFDSIYNEILKKTNELKNEGVLIPSPTNKSYDKFEHCYGGCILTRRYGGFVTMTAERIREKRSANNNPKDAQEDIMATKYGVIVGNSENGDCVVDCIFFNNMMNTEEENLSNLWVQHTNICGFDSKSTPGEASQQ